MSTNKITDILRVSDNSKHVNVLGFLDMNLSFLSATSEYETLRSFISAAAKPIALVSMFITPLNITQMFHLYTARKLHKASIFDFLRGY